MQASHKSQMLSARLSLRFQHLPVYSSLPPQLPGSHPIGVTGVSWSPAIPSGALVSNAQGPAHVKRLATSGCDNTIRVGGFVLALICSFVLWSVRLLCQASDTAMSALLPSITCECRHLHLSFSFLSVIHANHRCGGVRMPQGCGRKRRCCPAIQTG